MKSINVVKMLEEEEKTKAKERKSTDAETLLKDKIWNCIDNFIMPYVKSKIEMTEHEQVVYEDNLFNLLVKHNDFTEEDSIAFDEEERNFLNTSNRKVKVDIGNRYAETIIRTHTLDEKVEEYYNKYAKPMLKELQKQNVIIYDTEALDNKTKSATTKIDKLVKKIITDKAKESKMYSLFKKIFGNEFIEKNDVIFSDNKEQKEKFCNCIKTYIENNYDNIDYKAIDNIDFADMNEFKLD